MTQTRQTEWVGLQLEPLDTLLFRDGRPFDAATRVSGGLPNPQTLAGALRTALLARIGFDFCGFAARRKQDQGKDQDTPARLKEALTACKGPDWITQARFRGPWLALAVPDGSVVPLLPQPVVLGSTRKGGWLRSQPLEGDPFPGWVPPDNLLPLWRKGQPDSKAENKFLTLKAITSFLQGKDTCEATEVFSPGDLFGHDTRTGIELDMHTLTSAEGQLYGIRMLVLQRQVRLPEKKAGLDNDKPPHPYHGAEVCLYAEVLPGADAPAARTWFSEAVPLGGEGRYVRVKVVDARPSWPESNPSAVKSLWLLVTPAIFPAPGRLPKVPAGALRAAASASPLAVSGWDIARNGPRSTRFAIPAGAVYFVEGDFRPPDSSLCDDEALRAEGWGYALQGTW